MNRKPIKNSTPVRLYEAEAGELESDYNDHHSTMASPSYRPPV